MVELEGTSQDGKIAQELAKHTDAPIAIVADNEPKRTHPKTHVNYRKARLEHRTYARDGKTHEVPAWSVRIHFGGNRKSFEVERGNKEEAATKARDKVTVVSCAGDRGEAKPPRPAFAPSQSVWKALNSTCYHVPLAYGGRKGGLRRPCVLPLTLWD
jgi:hypothetical protein